MVKRKIHLYIMMGVGLTLGINLTAAAVTLSVENKSGASGASISVPVNVDQASGISGYQISIAFDPAILSCTTVQKGTLTNNSSWNLTPNIDNTAGTVFASGMDMSFTGLSSGSGSLAILVFTITGSPGQISPLSFNSGDCVLFDTMGGSIAFTTSNGQVSVSVVQATIAKSTTSLNFGTVLTNATFQIWNGGSGSINYNLEIDSGGSYFSLTPPVTGSSTGSADKKTHAVTVNRSGMAEGQTVTGRIKITSNEANNSPQYINLSASKAILGTTITVSANDPNADFDSIQEAINNSGDTDVIVVYPGIYNEHINFYGKSITITGTEPDNINVIYATTIDGGFTSNVVTFDSGEDTASILRGVNIQNGDKGIYCYYSNPIISKCVIRYHNTGVNGYNSEVTITDCLIRENDYAGIDGCDGIITGCVIAENLGWGIGSCDGPISRCIIKGNSSFGIYSGGATLTSSIKNCVISGNKSRGIQSYTGSLIENCTIVGNRDYGCKDITHGVICNNIIVLNETYGLQDCSGATLIYNNIWGNLSGNYSGTTPGETDTHENPLFALNGYWIDNNNWVEGDYHLQSVAGRWTETGWVNDDVTSPCIDAGDPTGMYNNEPAPNGSRVNQGAYGGTEKASKSPWGPEAYCGQYIPGDANLDCRIDLVDIAIICSHWLECNLVPEDACWDLAD